MSGKKRTDTTAIKNRFGGLRTYYLIALGTIALSIVTGQFFIQKHLNEQQGDAHVINIAGRQRMLVQRLSKMALQLDRLPDPADQLPVVKSLTAIQQEWTAMQYALQHGDDSLKLSADHDDEIRKQ